MIAISNTKAKNDFDNYCHVAVRNSETIIVVRESGENVVIMSQSEYDNLMENLYIRSNRANYENLLKSIDQAERGEAKIHELVEVDNELSEVCKELVEIDNE